jgi:fructose-bisphosphate aldolase, class I
MICTPKKYFRQPGLSLRKNRPASAQPDRGRIAHLEVAAAKKVYEDRDIVDISTPAARIRHVVQSAFNGRRIVVFSGGEAKDLDGVFAEVRAVRDGGGNGSIIGRNTFQRSKKDAIDMLSNIIKIYQGKD